MDPAWWTLESDRLELAGKVELLEMKLAKVDARHDNHAELNALVEQKSARKEALEQKVAALKSEVAALAAHAADEREQWLRSARAASVGRSFETFTGAKGRTYSDVQITRISDVGVEFKHATGSSRLAAADLTSEQQGDFGLDPRIASEALAAEMADARAYGEWVDQRVATVNARKDAEDAAVMAMTASVPVRRAPVTIAANESTRSGSRLRDEPRYFSRGDTTWYPSYYSGSCYTRSPYVARRQARANANGNWSYTTRRNSCNSPAYNPPRNFSINP